MPREPLPFLHPSPTFFLLLGRKVRIIKFDNAVQLMGLIPLSRRSTDVPEHEPRSCKLFRLLPPVEHLRCSLVLTRKIECQKPLRQPYVDLMEYRSRCYRNLVAALSILIPSAQQPVCVMATTF